MRYLYMTNVIRTLPVVVMVMGNKVYDVFNFGYYCRCTTSYRLVMRCWTCTSLHGLDNSALSSFLPNESFAFSSYVFLVLWPPAFEPNCHQSLETSLLFQLCQLPSSMRYWNGPSQKHSQCTDSVAPQAVLDWSSGLNEKHMPDIGIHRCRCFKVVSLYFWSSISRTFSVRWWSQLPLSCLFSPYLQPAITTGHCYIDSVSARDNSTTYSNAFKHRKNVICLPLRISCWRRAGFLLASLC